MNRYTFETYRGCHISYTPVDHFWRGQQTWSVCFDDPPKYFDPDNRFWNPVHFPRQSWRSYGLPFDAVQEVAQQQVNRWRDEYDPEVA